MGGHRTHTDTRPAWRKPWEFLTVFLLVFFLFSVALFAIDFVPEAPVTSTPDVTLSSSTVPAPVALAAETQVVAPTQGQVVPKTAPALPTAAAGVEAPRRVKIASVGIDTNVVNPASTDIKALDDALMKGAVRYPGSALLNENAGVFIFGHQSRLPVVKNKAFKAFANLQNVKQGEEVQVYSDSTVYTYRVVSITHASVNDALIQ